MNYTKQEVMQYLDQMDSSGIGHVLDYIKSFIGVKQKSPYGKYKTAEEYAEAQKLWEELENIRKDLAQTCEPISSDVDLIRETREAQWRKYESLT